MGCQIQILAEHCSQGGEISQMRHEHSEFRMSELMCHSLEFDQSQITRTMAMKQMLKSCCIQMVQHGRVYSQMTFISHERWKRSNLSWNVQVLTSHLSKPSKCTRRLRMHI